ncbi:LysR substrate-binding domain-containing protein [Streptomyces litmocidini]|uniref:LysR substrate-binding domain-containing protein n=1 Tax=Streptomyces litmocidini TaxID=67318 RepID=UPI0036F8C993
MAAAARTAADGSWCRSPVRRRRHQHPSLRRLDRLPPDGRQRHAPHQLAAKARQLLALVEGAEVRLEERWGRPAGRLTLACFASAARGLMPRVPAEPARHHPELDARLSEVDPHLSVDLVARGVIDLAVAHDWDIAPLPTPPGVEQVVIGDGLCDVLVHRDHPPAARESVRREEPAAARWISKPPGTDCHDWLTRTLRARGYEPLVVHQAEENHTQVALVAAGPGIALVPRLGRGALPPEVTPVRLDPMPTRRLHAIWRTGAARRPAIRETVRTLQELWPSIASAA